MEYQFFDKGLSEAPQSGFTYLSLLNAPNVSSVNQRGKKVRTVQLNLHTNEEYWLGTVLSECVKTIVGVVWTLAVKGVKTHS